jgi:hypothetical protein
MVAFTHPPSRSLEQPDVGQFFAGSERTIAFQQELYVAIDFGDIPPGSRHASILKQSGRGDPAVADNFQSPVSPRGDHDVFPTHDFHFIGLLALSVCSVYSAILEFDLVLVTHVHGKFQKFRRRRGNPAEQRPGFTPLQRIYGIDFARVALDGGDGLDPIPFDVNANNAQFVVVDWSPVVQACVPISPAIAGFDERRLYGDRIRGDSGRTSKYQDCAKRFQDTFPVGLPNRVFMTSSKDNSDDSTAPPERRR